MGRKRKDEVPAVGLREVAVDSPPIRTVWADPASLTPNPLNWRVHPEEQSRVVGDLIDRHGWLRPLLFNARTGLLVDGHDRRDIAIAKGLPAVPVWVGDWSEEQEAEILVALDESARMAGADAGKLGLRLERIVGETTEALDGLIWDLSKRSGLQDLLDSRGDDPEPVSAPPPGPDYGGEADDEEDEPEDDREPRYEATPAEDPTPAARQTRVVSLYLSGETYPEFRALVERLGPDLGTATDTDTVLAALRRLDADRGLIADESGASLAEAEA
jgi:hypothetical protein